MTAAVPFRLGLVGIGDMAGVHAAAAQRLGIELAIAAGHDASRAERLADERGGRLYPNYDALLNDPAITAVDLCVPNDLHRRYAERAFAAGKHVLCEKPIALSLADADAMIASAEAAGVTLMVGHVVRFWPEYRRLRELVANAELGEISWLSLRRLTGVLSATQGREGWRASAERSGGAALDLQIHDLDFACWLFGPPQSVFARGIRSPNGSWDHIATTLAYGDRTVIAEASFLMRDAPFEIGFHLVAERGVVGYRYSPASFALHGLHGDAAEPEAAPTLLLYDSAETPNALLQPDRDSFEAAIDGELAEFVKSVTSGQAPSCTGADARLALSVSLASVRSLDSGAVVEGPF